MKIAVNILIATFVASASAAPFSVHEGSWHYETPTFEEEEPGQQAPSGTSTLDITVTTFGSVVCGSYDGTLAMRQPKTSFFDFVGYQANGAAHVYFPNGFTGELDDIGEADIVQKGKTLEWRLTREPRHEDYLYEVEQLTPVQPDLKNRERLRKGCAVIANIFGKVNKNNAHDAVAKISSETNR
jgi:hypothetical protein